jgi:hypothetical protein
MLLAKMLWLFKQPSTPTSKLFMTGPITQEMPLARSSRGGFLSALCECGSGAGAGGMSSSLEGGFGSGLAEGRIKGSSAPLFPRDSGNETSRGEEGGGGGGGGTASARGEEDEEAASAIARFCASACVCCCSSFHVESQTFKNSPLLLQNYRNRPLDRILLPRGREGFLIQRLLKNVH